MKTEELSFGILAGGKSSRMGKNKAALTFGDSSFLEHILNQGRDFGECLVSVDKKEKYTWLPADTLERIRLVEDEEKEAGPTEGIYQILRNMRQDACLIVATDMPFLSRDFLQCFADAYTGEDCLVLTQQGRVQPLCAVYSRRCLAPLKKMRQKGERRPRLLFPCVNTRYLAIEDMDYDPSVIGNINTPEEYQGCI